MFMSSVCGITWRILTTLLTVVGTCIAMIWPLTAISLLLWLYWMVSPVGMGFIVASFVVLSMEFTLGDHWVRLHKYWFETMLSLVLCAWTTCIITLIL